MLRSFAILLCAAACGLALHTSAHAGQEHAADIVVSARTDGESVVIDVSFTVQANTEEVWKVLTDYDHVARYVSNVQSSRIVNKYDGKWLVAQTGKAVRGPLSFAFDSVQEFEFKPFEEIRSRLISGNMKKLDGVTQLTSHGDTTNVVFHGLSIPNVWVPPLIGTRIIETDVRDQYREIRNEIIRRKHAQTE